MEVCFSTNENFSSSGMPLSSNLTHSMSFSVVQNCKRQHSIKTCTNINTFELTYILYSRNLSQVLILRISKHSQKLMLAHDFYLYCFVCLVVIARTAFAIFCYVKVFINFHVLDVMLPRLFISTRTKRCTMFLVVF